MSEPITHKTRRISNEMVDRPKRRAEIMGILGNKMAMTSSEIARFMNRNVYMVRPRLTEMEQEGMLEVVGTRFNMQTHRPEAVYRLKS